MFTPDTTQNAQDFFRAAISKHMEREVKEAVEREAEKAAENVKQKIRELLPKITMGIFDLTSVSWDSKTTLCIRVEFKEPKNA